jgi:hypothetical protein
MIRSLTVNPAGGDVSRTQEPHLHLEVGHILFLDIVGYSKLLASYGLLKLLPFWDPLRGDPRFEKIVASLAPKEASK